MRVCEGVELEAIETAIPGELEIRIRRRVREGLACGPHGRSVVEEVERLVGVMGLQDLDRQTLTSIVADELRR